MHDRPPCSLSSMPGLEIIVGLLSISAVVAIACKYTRLPYAIALVITGLIIGLMPFDIPTEHLSPKLILFLFLPPLLFEGALQMNLEQLKTQAWMVFLLAVPGTIISTLVGAVGFHYLLDIPWVWAFLIGVMIVPTDPVSVLASFRQYGVAPKLALLVEGESVFNDGVGVVLYLLVLKFLKGQTLTVSEGMTEFLLIVIGGAAIGLILGYLGYLALLKLDDHLTEVTISVILAFSSYQLAEHLHMSGVIAAVVAGIITGNYGRVLAMEPTTRITLTHFWEVIVFLLNSLLFLLIGLRLNTVILHSNLQMLAVAVLIMLFSRAVSAYGLTAFSREIPWSWRHTIFWGGLRGSVPIALVLGLSGVENIDPVLQQQAVTLVFGMVLFSLLVQGLSMGWVLKKLGLVDIPGEELLEMEENFARVYSLKATLKDLEELRLRGEIPQGVYQDLEGELRALKEKSKARLKEILAGNPEIRAKIQERVALRSLQIQSLSISDALKLGLVSDEGVNKLRRSIHSRIDQIVHHR